MAAILLDKRTMTRKVLLLCALYIAALPAAWAVDPIGYKEIAMLLRNGENQQFIINDTARRRLLQPLSAEEVQNLLALHATPALISLLRDPATIVAPADAAAYTARIEQQNLRLLQEQRLADQAAANARLQQQQKQALPANPVAGGAGDSPDANATFLGKSIVLKFSAADGSPVDLDKLRGKVVLIDFWATWCGPCMREVPNVVAAYGKYHDKGVEIIGISLDKDKDALLRVTAQKGMTWPQYFDGEGWNNQVSTRCKIRSIPTMWLINKHGLVASINARDNLDAEITRLLAE
jgi:thiol-disulfide isomerase/thioredoxin